MLEGHMQALTIIVKSIIARPQFPAIFARACNIERVNPTKSIFSPMLSCLLGAYNFNFTLNMILFIYELLI